MSNEKRLVRRGDGTTTVGLITGGLGLLSLAAAKTCEGAVEVCLKSGNILESIIRVDVCGPVVPLVDNVTQLFTGPHPDTSDSMDTPCVTTPVNCVNNGGYYKDYFNIPNQNNTAWLFRISAETGTDNPTYGMGEFDCVRDQLVEFAQREGFLPTASPATLPPRTSLGPQNGTTMPPQPKTSRPPDQSSHGTNWWLILMYAGAAVVCISLAVVLGVKIYRRWNNNQNNNVAVDEKSHLMGINYAP